MALRAAGLVADDVAVETSMSTLMAAWSSSLWSQLLAPRLFAGASSLMPVAMASALLMDSYRGYS
ncbi:hypothetical protein PF008_g14552 [Phytophthora fragariae]|uniref:Uncharacterized protein n=1 Tax=Phytophthora fragariae TaxID=53985 RepID=A0A6G0RGR1_9STRA|nr:hypothetical protein PF008_g14552 [Phytophthora fragariae]